MPTTDETLGTSPLKRNSIKPRDPSTYAGQMRLAKLLSSPATTEAIRAVLPRRTSSARMLGTKLARTMRMLPNVREQRTIRILLQYPREEIPWMSLALRR